MQTRSPAPRKDEGLQKKIQLGKRMFRIAENTQHYSEEDYKQAEKQFIKYCVLEERCAYWVK
ncbi:MAG: hypothetical protein M0036_23530 [Desulfobacteraceae bacterium]|nr:hypothetical protein [Desulfobacteraceae bacterium]